MPPNPARLLRTGTSRGGRILVRAVLSPRAAQLGAAHADCVIDLLTEAGFPRPEAETLYTAIQFHVRAAVVLQRLYDRNFEFGLQCLLDHAETVLAASARPKAAPEGR